MLNILWFFVKDDKRWFKTYHYILYVIITIAINIAAIYDNGR